MERRHPCLRFAGILPAKIKNKAGRDAREPHAGMRALLRDFYRERSTGLLTAIEYSIATNVTTQVASAK